jgi:hypothetical protein
MLLEGGMISESEKVEIVKNSQTSQENVGMLEKFFLAMISLAKGDKVDVKNIAKAVNKKFPNLTPLDVNKVVLINEVS